LTWFSGLFLQIPAIVSHCRIGLDFQIRANTRAPLVRGFDAGESDEDYRDHWIVAEI
jgi:hypothetical protein